MLKLIWLLLIASLFCKLLAGRWPWQILGELIGPSARSGEVRRAQALLGVSRKPSREQVIEAHRRLVARVHPDRGGTEELVHEANAARDLLLEETRRG